jgi:hypothetical protein
MNRGRKVAGKRAGCWESEEGTISKGKRLIYGFQGKIVNLKEGRVYWKIKMVGFSWIYLDLRESR